MKKFTTKSGETAYVPTDDEKNLIVLAVRQFKATLPLTERRANG